MEWYRQVQFVAAVPMPPDMAAEFGTTVNGMWASPERGSAEAVADLHDAGQRVLFSVPMIALVPEVYEDPATADLLEEVCRDVDGGRSECGWYYWESKPVYAACISSDRFREAIFDLCTRGIDLGADVVNLDEIMTSVGLMNRDQRGTGFCARCLEAFREDARSRGEQVEAGDDALRATLKADDEAYARYRTFQERRAFGLMTAFIADLRAYAAEVNPGFAVGANVAYLGNLVEAFGPLWGCVWAPHLDQLLMENDYRVTHDAPHLILPRGGFAPWYRLGASFDGVPIWICPSINVPRQLADEDRRVYHELMFLEAYAHGGRWGYYWWPGVDAETRRRATAPDAIKDHIGFIRDHRDRYEGTTSMNELAVLYLEGPMLRRPGSHERYLALAQTLGELGYQFDVRWVGDGVFNPDELDASTLAPYRAVLVPEARDAGAGPGAALEAYAGGGGEVVAYSDGPLDASLVRLEDGELLSRFWRGYADDDRARIGATVEPFAWARIRASDPTVRVVRSASGSDQVLHLLNLGYEPDADRVAPVADLQVRLPWRGGPAPPCTVATLGGDRRVDARVEGDELVLDIGALDRYALVVIDGGAA